MPRRANHRNKQRVHAEGSSSKTNNIAVENFYLSHLLDDDQKGILITSISTGYKTENKNTLKLEHSDHFGLLQLSYRGPKFIDYFPPNTTVKISEVLLKKTNTKSNEFCLEDIQKDVRYGFWNIKHIITEKESDCHYLFKEAIQDKYTIVLAILLNIIDANNSSRPFAFYLHDDNCPLLHRAVEKKDMEFINTLLNYNLDINTKNKAGWTPLHVAIDSEMPDIVDFLISNGADVNAQNDQLQLPLHFAAKRSNSNILNSLLDNQAKFNEPDINGWTPLHYAVAAKNNNAIDILLSRGACYTLEDELTRTPFHLAAQQKSLDIIEIFLNHNVSASIVNSRKQTPLFYLSKIPIDAQPQSVHKRMYLKIINALLQKGASINFQDLDGWTPLHHALNKKNIEFAEALLECNAYATIQNSYGKNALHLACWRQTNKCLQGVLDHNININGVDHNKRTALHAAAEANNHEAVELILKKNPNINMQDNSGKTALHIAVEKKYLPIVEILLKNGANVNAVTVFKSTVLHLAIESKFSPTIKLLLENKADVNLKNISNKTALHLAVKNSIPIEIIKSILNFTNDINAKDSNERTPLHYAVLNHHLGILECLLEKNVDVNAKDSEGKTSLHLTMCFKDELCIKCIKVLVNHKADVNAVDNNLTTPLHSACFVKNVEAVKYLIENGANFRMRDKNGKTVFHYACMRNMNGTSIFFYNMINYIKEILNILVEKDDILINCGDETGKTPLHCVVDDDSLNISELLLKNGADINIVDDHNNGALDILMKKINNSLYKYLLKDAAMLFGQVVKMKVLGMWVHQRILDKIYRGNYQYDLKWIQNYERNCNEEIDLMKKTNINQSNKTYYDFLKKSSYDVIDYACNQNIVSAIKSDKLIDKFPIYGHLLKCQLRNVLRRLQSFM